MFLKPKRAYPAHRETLLRSRNARMALTAALIIVLGAAVLSGRGWRRSASAEESPGAEAAVVASPGDLDLTFGVDGTVTTDLGNKLDDSACAVAAQPDGKVVAVGYISTGSTGRDFAVIRLNTNGTLDSTFGDGGKLSFNFNSATRDDLARAVAIQPDGKIVVAGEADVLGFGNFDIVLARLHVDGSFDTSFGNGGKVVTNLPNNRADFGRALALQPDGKILVAGYSNRPTTGDDFVAVRYDPNGSPDTTFGAGGVVTTDILSNREDRAAAAALQTDGRIVVAGYTDTPSFKKDFAAVRYNPDGSLDSNFNATGKVNTDLNLNSDDIGNAVTLQGDGRIVVAGQSAANFGVVRYNANGSPDTNFGGGNGVAITNFGTGSVNIGRAVVVQSNGKITVAGRSQSELAFARYNPDGTLDNSFGVNGRRVQNAGNNYISGFGGYWGMALQSDGKIVAAGDGWRDGFSNDFTVSRLNPNGTFDAGFGGGDGIASTDINGRFDEASSVVIQPDGKIVVAGSAQNSTGGFDFVVARYNADGTPDASFGGGGIVTTDINGHNNDHGSAVALQPDGKILVAGYTNNAGDGLVDDGALLRYNSNGTPDATFGSGGVAILTGAYVTKGGLAWVRHRSIALQSDGRIIAAGEAHYFSIYSDGLLTRYNANGTLDGTFAAPRSDNSIVPGTALIHFADITTLNAVKIQSDGKAVAAGSVNDGPAADFALVRLNTNGTVDTSFGGGKVTTNFSNGHFDAAYDLAIQPDGKLIAVGETIASGTGSDFGIARYNLNGSLDSTFGGGTGMENIDFVTYRDYCSGVAVQPNGKIVLAGLADDQIPTGWGVVKLNTNGTFDTSFGGGSGKVRTFFGDAVGSALNPAPYDMALQADGKIVVVGRVNFNSTDRDLTLVRYENNNPACTYTLNPTNAVFAAAGGNGSFNVAAPAGCGWGAQSNAAWIATDSSGTGGGSVTFTIAANTAPSQRAATIMVGGQTFNVTQQAASASSSFVQFNSLSYNASEGAGGAVVVVTRSGNTASAVSVDYTAADGTAHQRSDYTPASGTLDFAAGVLSKSFTVPLIDNAYIDGNRTVGLTLSNAVRAAVGGSDTITLTILDNDFFTPTINPIELTPFYTGQHYRDFLSRVPDTSGLNFWTNEVESCGSNAACREVKRVNVSAAFFLSIEFQETGYLVYKTYKASYGNLPGKPVPVTYRQLLNDTQRIGNNVIVNQGDWQGQLEANKQAFFQGWVQRPEFLAIYPAGMSAANFVDALNTNIGGLLSVSERNTLVAQLTSNNTTQGRASVLRQIAENAEFTRREFNRAFVLMQYFGYLRRNPDDAPDSNFSGYNFWLSKLDQFNGNFVSAEMVKAFIASLEYRRRFAP